MNIIKFLLFALVVAATMMAVVGRPDGGARTVELMQTMNRTVCPIMVEVDEDADRVPRRIKLMKCAPQPNKWCVKHGIPRHECCEHSHNNHVMECVEIHDTVMVYYNKSDSMATFDVAVGCTCMFEQIRHAGEVPAGSA